MECSVILVEDIDMLVSKDNSEFGLSFLFL